MARSTDRSTDHSVDGACPAAARWLARRFVRGSTATARSTDRRWSLSACPAAARRLARIASADGSLRDGPRVLSDGSLATLRWMVRIEMGPAYCPTARSQRFGGWFGLRRAQRIARRLARDASADGSSVILRRRLARRIVGGCTAHARRLPDGLRISFRRLPNG